jgi:transposase
MGTRKIPLKGELRTSKIRMLPSAAQRKELKCWFAGVRHCYNSTVAKLNDGARGSTIDLRKEVTSEKCLIGDKEWVREIPSRTRAVAVQDAVAARRACLTKITNKQIKHFKLKFRSFKHSSTESLGVEKSMLSLSQVQGVSDHPKRRANRRLHIAPRSNLGKLGAIDLVDSHKVMSHLDANGIKEDCRIQWIKASDQFYLCVPREVVPKPSEKDHTRGPTAALDPGVRGFQTYYTPSGEHGTLLEGMLKERLMGLATRVDKLQSAASKCKDKQKARRMRRRQQKLWAKIRHIRQDAHYSAIGFLWDNFDNVLIPEFETSKMVKKEGRCIGKRTAREMLTCAHYEFRQRLIHSRIHRADKHVYVVKEGCTTKTCGLCGTQNHSVKCKKVFECPNKQCNAKIDRDVNGARNIMLRAVFHGPMEHVPSCSGQTIEC